VEKEQKLSEKRTKRNKVKHKYEQNICTERNEMFFGMCVCTVYTVTKSEPNEAVLWKITLQKMENSLVDTGIFILPLIQYLYRLYAGKVFQSLDGIITGIDEVYQN